jgi:hypothetical protein
MRAEDSVPAEPLVVLCSTCGGAVRADDACPTCGEREPQEPHADPASRLDESLLDQVDVALAAQVALARRTAVRRIARTAQLNAEAASLRRRLRTQTMLLRTLRSKRRRAPLVAHAIERIDEALLLIDADAPPGCPWGVRVQLPRDPTCGTVARRLLDEYVHDHLTERAASDALTVATELATNAYVHGTGAITLRIERLSDRLRIEVFDEGRPRLIDVDSRSGTSGGRRGLHMVDEVSLAWGANQRPIRVWAEMPIA